MDIFVKEFPDCLKQAFVRIGIFEVSEEFDNALARLQPNFAFDGYRKGKVPFEVIERTNPPELSQTVVRNLVNRAVMEISSLGHRLFSEPNFNPLSPLPNRNSEFSFYLVFETAPKVLKDLDLEKAAIDFEEYVVNDKIIEHMAKRQLKTLEPVTGKIEKEDVVTVKVLNSDYQGETEISMDASEVAGLIGHKKGDKLDLSFEELGNYVVHFLGKTKEPVQLEISQAERNSVSKMDDELIQQTTKYKSVAEFKTSVKQSLENMANDLNNAQKRKALMSYIGKNTVLEIPKSVFVQNARHHLSHFVEDNYYVSEIPLKELIENPKIKENLAAFPQSTHEEIGFVIAIDHIADTYNVETSEAQVNHVAAQRARENKISLDEYKKRCSTEEWESVQREARRESALSFVLNKVKFTPKGTKPLMEI